MSSGQNTAVVWIEPQPVDVPEAVLQMVGGNRVAAECLVRLGITTSGDAASFLYPDHYTPAPPADLPDLERAAERLELAIQRGERIGVWGDFDVDGQTSTTLLVAVLRGLGASVEHHIPVRSLESHGVKVERLQSFLESGVQVVLTCDTGITAHEAAGYARRRGVDFIITDHHTLPPELPQAFAVVNPQRLPEGHPSRSLPGVGTAYKLAEELARRAGRPELAEQQLDLVAMGTVADLAILSGDARWLVQRGLEVLRNNTRLGLAAIFERTGLKAERLTEEHISFQLAPRLNAIGRLDDANPIVDFLLTEDKTFASVTATRLEGMNAQRKMLTDQVFQAAMSQLDRDPGLLDGPALVLAHPQWPAGVIGIVASRLVEQFYRPVVLLATPPGAPARGSARSIEGINITSAIAANEKLLLGFGGHPMAAGLSLDAGQVSAFRQGLNRAVQKQMHGQDLAQRLRIDAYLKLDEISLDLVEQLDVLAPFGPGNPSPVFAAHDLRLRSVAKIGKNAEHVQLLVEDGMGTIKRVIWWQGAGMAMPEGRFDLAFRARSSSFRGEPEVSLEFAGYRITEAPALIPEPVRTITVIDLRQELDPQAALDALAGESGLLLWQEGEFPSRNPGCDRYHITASPTLAIWNPPPAWAVLEAAIAAASPDTVYLLGAQAALDKPEPFLNRLAGLARYAMMRLHGNAPLGRLAAATAQREETVRKGLQWWEARGAFLLVEEEDHNFILMEGSRPDESRQAALMAEIKELLEETAAFRAYYMRAAPERLVVQETAAPDRDLDSNRGGIYVKKR